MLIENVFDLTSISVDTPYLRRKELRGRVKHEPLILELNRVFVPTFPQARQDTKTRKSWCYIRRMSAPCPIFIFFVNAASQGRVAPTCTVAIQSVAMPFSTHGPDRVVSPQNKRRKIVVSVFGTGRFTAILEQPNPLNLGSATHVSILRQTTYTEVHPSTFQGDGRTAP